MIISPHRIVAEISTSWPKSDPQIEDQIGSKFERVIAVNRERGYALESWRFQATLGKIVEGAALTETIIAVFVEIR